jgi:hypothetical protein
MKKRFAACAAIVLLPLFAWPSLSLAQEPEQPRVRPNRQLLTAGTIAFGLPYTASVVAAAGSERDSDNHLYLPVVGPWLALADRGGCGPSGCDDAENTARGLLIANGIVQGGGALLVLGSLLVPERRLPAAPAARTGSVRLTPGMVGRSGYGLAAWGQF